MSSFLHIIINDDNTLIEYISQNENLFNYKNNFGIKFLERSGLSRLATDNFTDSVIYALEQISLYDRIPTEFILDTPSYASWLKNSLEEKSYAQFFTDEIPVRVIINNNKDNLSNHARHKKTRFSFKV